MSFLVGVKNGGLGADRRLGHNRSMLGTLSHHLPASHYRRERWRNGAGWTREILAIPESQDWALRLSIAELNEPARYSKFPGVEREQVLLSGESLQLGFDDGEQVRLRPPYQRHRFSGERPLEAVPEGPVQAFNLMWKPDLLDVEVLHRPLVGDLFCFAEAGSAWAVHLLGGQMGIEGPGVSFQLASGDTAWLSGASGRRYAIDGGGEVLLMRVRPSNASLTIASEVSGLALSLQ